MKIVIGIYALIYAVLCATFVRPIADGAYMHAPAGAAA
jgi:hypothetical protein